MKAAGITPCRRQWVWSVEPQVLRGMFIPQWARDAAVRGLGQQQDSVWLWWVDARRLIALDRAAAGRSKVTRAELRHCPVCGRPFVGIEAEKRRRLDESGPHGRNTPCGDACVRDAESRVWRKLDPFYRTAQAKEVQR